MLEGQMITTFWAFPIYISMYSRGDQRAKLNWLVGQIWPVGCLLRTPDLITGRGFHGTQHLVFRLSHFNATYFCLIIFIIALIVVVLLMMKKQIEIGSIPFELISINKQFEGCGKIDLPLKSHQNKIIQILIFALLMYSWSSNLNQISLKNAFGKWFLRLKEKHLFS